MCRHLTEGWLNYHSIPFNTLMMRQAGSTVKDTVVKREFYEDYIRDRYNVKFVLDDRLSVCRLWHDLGLPLLRVGDPDAEF